MNVRKSDAVILTNAKEIRKSLDRWTNFIRDHVGWRDAWQYEIILSQEDFDTLNEERSMILEPIDPSKPITYNGFPVSVSSRGNGTRLVKIIADETEIKIWE